MRMTKSNERFGKTSRHSQLPPTNYSESEYLRLFPHSKRGKKKTQHHRKAYKRHHVIQFAHGLLTEGLRT